MDSMAKTKEEKKSNKDELTSLIHDLQEKYGEGAIMKLGETPKVDVAIIPTG